MKRLRALAFLALLSGCVEPTSPLATSGYIDRPAPPIEGAVRVASVAELKEALAACRTWIAGVGAQYFRSSADAIDLDESAKGCTHTLVIYGGGDWGSGQINRLASFPEPLIRAGRSRDWELHFYGLLFDGWSFEG